jgi:hypothetical protein
MAALLLAGVAIGVLGAALHRARRGRHPQRHDDGRGRIAMARGMARRRRAQAAGARARAVRAAGKAQRMLGVNMDVTARSLAEQRMREAKARLEVARAAAKRDRWHLDLATLELTTSATSRANFGRQVEEPFHYGAPAGGVPPRRPRDDAGVPAPRGAARPTMRRDARR